MKKDVDAESIRTHPSLRLVSISEWYDVVKSGRGDLDQLRDDRRPKRVPRDMSPSERMRPVSDDESMARVRRDRAVKKDRRDAVKAVKRGRGPSMPLLGPNGRLGNGSRSRSRFRSRLGSDGRPGPRSSKAKFVVIHRKRNRLQRAMETMSGPSGSPKPPKVYLPGIHSPKSPVRRQPGLISPSKLKKPKNIGVTKGFDMSTSTNFNDLFKSELGGSTDDHLVDCPHCDAPITKSDLAKAHKGKGRHSEMSGAKRGKSSAHVVDHNPDGGVMRGGDGRGVLTSSRGVPGAKKTDENRVQSAGKRSGSLPGISKADDAVDEGDAGDVTDDQGAADVDPVPPTVKKSVTIRGTDYVRYVDDGSDAALAKAIAEGSLGGTNPTQPLDLNNDLTRLLI